jgi:hypothetical protein
MTHIHLSGAGGGAPSVTCITIIDTIILTNYTNDAYTYDTHTPLRCWGRSTPQWLKHSTT